MDEEKEITTIKGQLEKFLHDADGIVWIATAAGVFSGKIFINTLYNGHRIELKDCVYLSGKEDTKPVKKLVIPFDVIIAWGA